MHADLTMCQREPRMRYNEIQAQFSFFQKVYEAIDDKDCKISGKTQFRGELRLLAKGQPVPQLDCIKATQKQTQNCAPICDGYYSQNYQTKQNKLCL